MSWSASTDPLALLGISTGQINRPNSSVAAQSAASMDGDQKFAVIGEPVPIVFCKYNNGGGVMLEPPATERRFWSGQILITINGSDTPFDKIQVFYLLVISQGQIDQINSSDVYQGKCQQVPNNAPGAVDPYLISFGTLLQAYNQRAAQGNPGTYLNAISGYWPTSFPVGTDISGSPGTYADVTNYSVGIQYNPSSDRWKKKINIFIRGGMHVTRLQDGAVGSSSSFPDLFRWMLQRTSMVPDALIDNDTLAQADLFCRVNGFTFNGIIDKGSNLGDLTTTWAKYFLLGESSKHGKRGLRPLLPVTSSGAINTGSITPAYVFDESLIVAGSFEVSYVSITDRLPFVCETLWRQQETYNFGIPRTSEVTFANISYPKETHDLSQFCTSETHAVKVAACILARRRYITHTCRFTALPGDHGALLSPGDIIRVYLARQASASAASVHDFFYQIERMSINAQGQVGYDCSHFPIDSSQRSLIALQVAAVQPTGYMIADNRSGLACDLTTTVAPAATPQPADQTPVIEMQELSADNGGNGGSQRPTPGVPAPPTLTYPTSPVYPTGYYAPNYTTSVSYNITWSLSPNFTTPTLLNNAFTVYKMENIYIYQDRIDQISIMTQSNHSFSTQIIASAPSVGSRIYWRVNNCTVQPGNGVSESVPFNHP